MLCFLKLNRPLSCCTVGWPGADAFSGLMAAKVRKPPYLLERMRLSWPFSLMEREMVGAAQGTNRGQRNCN